MPYELDDTGEATLGKPTEVRIRFVPAETATEPTAEAVKEALAAATAPLSEEQKRARGPAWFRGFGAVARRCGSHRPQNKRREGIWTGSTQKK